MQTLKSLSIAVLIAVAAFTQSACTSSSEAEKVAVKFTQTVYEGKIDDALAMIDTRALNDVQKVNLTERLTIFAEATLEHAENAGGYKSSESVGMDGKCLKDGEVCRVFVLSVFGDGKRDKTTCQIINVGGKYMVKLNSDVN